MLAPPARAAKLGSAPLRRLSHSAAPWSPRPVAMARATRAPGPRRPASMLYLTMKMPARPTHRPPSHSIQLAARRASSPAPAGAAGGAVGIRGDGTSGAGSGGTAGGMAGAGAGTTAGTGGAE